MVCKRGFKLFLFSSFNTILLFECSKELDEVNEAFASSPNYREVSKNSVININFILVKINAKKSVINKMSKKNFNEISIADFSFALGSNMINIGTGDQILMKEFRILLFITIHSKFIVFIFSCFCTCHLSTPPVLISLALSFDPPQQTIMSKLSLFYPRNIVCIIEK